MDVRAPHHSADLYRLLVDQACGHAIMLMDPHGLIRSWNPAAERMFGYKPEQILGQPSSVLFTPDDRERGIPELEMRIAASGTTSEDDRWHLRSDHSKFWSSGTLDALWDARGSLVGYVKIMRDRTNIRERLDLLKNKVRAGEEERSNQQVFVTTLSHELRNVISSLTHGLQLLHAPDVDAARRDKLIGLMREQIQLVQRLTEDLLDVERLKSGKLSLQSSRVVLQDVLIRAIELLRPKMEARRVRLELLEPGSPIVVTGDPDRLLQVFGNVLDNAVKYTSEGGRIWIKATVEDPHGVVHVQDDGVGIPPEMLSRIFDLFTQVDPNVSARGLGIGLSLVRDLVTLHGGSVQARSEGPGRGSEFSIRLPLRRAGAHTED